MVPSSEWAKSVKCTDIAGYWDGMMELNECSKTFYILGFCPQLFAAVIFLLVF
jgi:hypothetical protein